MGHPVSTMNLVDIELIKQAPLMPPYDCASHTWRIGIFVDCVASACCVHFATK